MPLTKTATDGLLRILGFLHPEYKDLITFLEAHEDQLIAVGPLIQQAAKEGPGALAAAEKAAPDLAKAIRNFIKATPDGANSTLAEYHAENVVRQITGSPTISPADWFNRSLPEGYGTSQVGSG